MHEKENSTMCVKMNYLITIVRILLTRKENYREWYKNIKRTLIFNDLRKGIREAVVFTEEQA
jgi:hypothetical protein